MSSAAKMPHAPESNSPMYKSEVLPSSVVLSSPRPRLLYIAWTEPSGGSGACLAVRRHLIEHDDVEVFVVTDKRALEPGVPWLQVQRSRIHARLSRTRFRRWVSNYEMTLEPYFVAAQDFEGLRRVLRGRGAHRTRQ